jgi:hypothetical protein
MNRFLPASVFLFSVLSVTANDAAAQGTGQAQRLQASGRAATSVCISNQCRMTDTSLHTILIEYGQTHARGREVWGTLVPLDTVWRLGANGATHLITKVPLSIGTAQIPAGAYSLHLRPGASEAHLIVSNATGMWGIPYPGAQQDRARVPMRSRTLSENIESLVIALVPNTTTGNSGVLTVMWGRREFSVDWTARLAGSGPG